MKTERNILIAFILNLAFSLFEFIGGIFTGSIAIISDAIHDIGDAFSIGLSFVLERKSKQKPDEKYTYGYARLSVLASAITTLILLIGSSVVFYNAIDRIINPTTINYNGMIIFAVVGVIVNFVASLVTRHGDSLNQKAVNLHMLEDVLGWIVVFIGAVVMKFTNLYILDPILSILVSLFIFISAIKNLKEIVDIFLEKTPKNIDINQLKKHIEEINGVQNAHHIHVWSMDGINNYATVHIVTSGDTHSIKEEIRKELKEFNIIHTTIETEEDEHCHEIECEPHFSSSSTHCHHHH